MEIFSIILFCVCVLTAIALICINKKVIQFCTVTIKYVKLQEQVNDKVIAILESITAKQPTASPELKMSADMQEAMKRAAEFEEKLNAGLAEIMNYDMDKALAAARKGGKNA